MKVEGLLIDSTVLLYPAVDLHIVVAPAPRVWFHVAGQFDVYNLRAWRSNIDVDRGIHLVRIVAGEARADNRIPVTDDSLRKFWNNMSNGFAIFSHFGHHIWNNLSSPTM